MSASYGQQVSADLRGPTKALRAHIPDVYASFAGLARTAVEPGALDTKTKELIALALSVALACDGCIASHARSSAAAGATPEEAAEAIGVTFLMEGGTATVYGPRAFEAFMESYESSQQQAVVAEG